MDLIYKKAALADLDVLVQTRLEVIRLVWELPASADMSALDQATRAYYRAGLADGSHTAYLVYNNDAFAATGAICYYRLMPTGDNPTGRKAYIMNMYTRPAYRRQGLAAHVLDLLVQDARSKGITMIALESSAMGRPVYAKYGFAPARDEMLLNLA